MWGRRGSHRDKLGAPVRTVGRKSWRIAAIAALAVFTAGAPAAFGATGLKSYEGSDYSQDLYTAGAVKACDMEADGRDVYAEFTVLGSGTVQQIWDSNGANNACEYTGDYGDYRIYKHRILESIPVFPDNAGPWKYPS
jgi:hypothetical protein